MMEGAKKIIRVGRALLRRRVVIVCDAIPYRFENVPYRKIFNWIAVELSATLRPSKPWGFPTHLQIEPTNTCNLRCVLCPVSGEMDRTQGVMDLSLFKKLIDEIGDSVFLILLWDWGEPFLNPSVYEMIAYARAKGIRVVSSTNGHCFARQEEADRVIRSGLDTLIFAVDGISQETYEAYRRKGDLATALQGIRTLAARKRALGSATPLINFRFLVMRHNEHEVPLLKDFALSLGADALTLKTLNPCVDNTYGEKRRDLRGADNPFLPAEKRFRRFDHTAGGPGLIRLSRNPCKNLWNAATIHWNGVVCPCTYDYSEKFVLGDLKKSSFEDIWSGPAYRRMRRRLRENDKENYFCHECSYAYQGGSCIDETIVGAFFYDAQGVRT